MKIKKGNMTFLTSCLLAQLFFMGIALVLLLVSCAIIVSFDDPDKVIKPVTLAILYLSALMGGITADRLSGDGVASGAVSGIISSVIVLLLSFIPFPASVFDATTSIICVLLMIPSSVLGSVLGRKKSKKPNSFKKKKLYQ